MTATTDILPFAIGSGALVQAQSAYAGSATQIDGFGVGYADETIANKAWRQSAFIAAGIANLCVQHGISVPDDGNLTTLIAELQAMIVAVVGTNTPHSLFNLQTVTNSTRTSISGSVANVFTTAISGTITKQSATSNLIFWAITPSYSGGSGGDILKVSIGTGSVTNVAAGALSTTSFPPNPSNGILTGLPSGSLAWSIAYANGNGGSWSNVVNPNNTDNTYLPSATTTTLIFGEFEP